MKVRGDMADYTKGQPGTSGFKNENLEVEGDKAYIKGQPGSSVFRTGNGSTKIRKDLAAYTNVQPGPSALRNAYASRQRLPPLEQILPLPPADPNCVCGCFFFKIAEFVSGISIAISRRGLEFCFFWHITRNVLHGTIRGT